VLALFRCLGVDQDTPELDEGFCRLSSALVTSEFESVSAAPRSLADDLIGFVRRLVAFFFDFSGIILRLHYRQYTSHQQYVFSTASNQCPPLLQLMLIGTYTAPTLTWFKYAM